jgi:hypothetical protein
MPVDPDKAAAPAVVRAITLGIDSDKCHHQLGVNVRRPRGREFFPPAEVQKIAPREMRHPAVPAVAPAGATIGGLPDLPVCRLRGCVGVARELSSTTVPHRAIAGSPSLGTLRFAINGMADLGPVGQQERIADNPSCTSDFLSNELLEDGIKKRVATLAAQHVALVAGVQQNGLALALRS